MNTLSRTFRLVYVTWKNCLYVSRLLNPVTMKPQRFCSRLPDSQDDFDEFETPFAGHKMLENIDIDDIVGDDLDKKMNLKKLILELSMKMQSEIFFAPKNLTSDQWRHLLNYKGDKGRKRYLEYLYVKEKRRETRDVLSSIKAEQLKCLREAKNMNQTQMPCTTNSPLVYSLKCTTLFNRIHDAVLQRLYNSKLASAMMFGEDLLIDCSYEEYMTTSGINSCARHILYLYSRNRLSNSPFNLILCNLNKNGEMMKKLCRTFSKLDEDGGAYFITTTEKHYLDMYPKEKLIYMTPHCYTDMETYEPDSIYILGAYVDAGRYKPLSQIKAKKDGVRTVRLPLDKYLNWCGGSKLLPFNSCAHILNDIKDGACWQYALRLINIRKQKFQYLNNDIDIKNEKKLAAAYVREESERTMLRDLQHKWNNNKKGKLEITFNGNS